MLYAKVNLTFGNNRISGSIGDDIFKSVDYELVSEVKADGWELDHCRTILGRKPSDQFTHIFVGDAAREIAANWNLA